MNLESRRKLEDIIEAAFYRIHSRCAKTGDARRAIWARGLWHPYVCSLGMHLVGHMENDGRLYVVDPATMMESSWGAGDGVEFVVVPEELAMKLLALGEMP